MAIPQLKATTKGELLELVREMQNYDDFGKHENYEDTASDWLGRTQYGDEDLVLAVLDHPQYDKEVYNELLKLENINLHSIMLRAQKLSQGDLDIIVGSAISVNDHKLAGVMIETHGHELSTDNIDDLMEFSIDKKYYNLISPLLKLDKRGVKTVSKIVKNFEQIKAEGDIDLTTIREWASEITKKPEKTQLMDFAKSVIEGSNKAIDEVQVNANPAGSEYLLGLLSNLLENPNGGMDTLEAFVQSKNLVVLSKLLEYEIPKPWLLTIANRYPKEAKEVREYIGIAPTNKTNQALKEIMDNSGFDNDVFNDIKSYFVNMSAGFSDEKKDAKRLFEKVAGKDISPENLVDIIKEAAKKNIVTNDFIFEIKRNINSNTRVSNVLARVRAPGDRTFDKYLVKTK